MLLPQGADANAASKIADKTIEFTSKTAYYVTKYTLKGGWFILKKASKGVKAVSTSVYRAAGDAFSKNNRNRDSYNSDYYEDGGTLPPPPQIQD